MNTTLTKRKKKYRVNEITPSTNMVISIIMSIVALCVLVPILLVISISFTSQKGIDANGYTLIPSEFSLEAYKSLIDTGASLGRSYLMTIFYSFFGTFLSLFVMSMFAYVLAQKNFKPRRFFAFMAYLTTLFSAGLVPTYVINTRLLHLNDTIWIFLLPGLVNAFNVIILRTFIQTTIPDSLFEAAKLDGANDWTVYCRIVLPLSKAGLATISLTTLVLKWNDWFTGLLYISQKPKLVPIMTYLQKIQKTLDFLKKNADVAATPEGMELLRNIPSESVRMAITILAVLPLLIAYPFFQKYFVKGMTVGSVKG